MFFKTRGRFSIIWEKSSRFRKHC